MENPRKFHGLVMKLSLDFPRNLLCIGLLPKCTSFSGSYIQWCRKALRGPGSTVTWGPLSCFVPARSDAFWHIVHGTIFYSECQKSQRLRTLFKFIVSFFSRSMPIIFLLNFFGGWLGGPRSSGAPGSLNRLNPR